MSQKRAQRASFLQEAPAAEWNVEFHSVPFVVWNPPFFNGVFWHKHLY